MLSRYRLLLVGGQNTALLLELVHEHPRRSARRALPLPLRLADGRRRHLRAAAVQPEPVGVGEEVCEEQVKGGLRNDVLGIRFDT